MTGGVTLSRAFIVVIVCEAELDSGISSAPVQAELNGTDYLLEL